MGTEFTGTQGDSGRPTAHLLLLDALDEVLIVVGHPSTTTRGLVALCRMLARLVAAPAAAHVRYNARLRKTRLTLWRQCEPATALAIDEPVPDPHGPHDWWTTSAARPVLLDSLDLRYLAELPLNPDPRLPTMLVVGREHPFTDADSERMAMAYRSLFVVERVAEGLQTPRIPRLAAEAGYRTLAPGAGLTGREQEVLKMLGEGLLARSIAQRLEVSERTVHKHLGNVYRKLDAHDRLLAVRRAEVLGLLPAPQTAGW
jgi:DNA-binding CsgD family transcriptional regulator